MLAKIPVPELKYCKVFIEQYNVMNRIIGLYFTMKP